jgi:geranylgeranyl diphosphate synthase, type II
MEARMPSMNVMASALETIEGTRARVEARLQALFPSGEGGRGLTEAMSYSLLAGGKRLRPVLTVLTARTLGADPAIAVDPACAVEMVHTASLILDDLPCMDDALLRRGRAANHRVFGEDVANLAAVSLLSEAFGVLSRAPGLGAGVRCQLVELLADTIGAGGLADGQLIDLASAASDRDSLERMQAQKTGALFVTAARIGARIAGAAPAEQHAVARYAMHAGLAFQICDDLLDTYGDGATLGKDLAQDGGKPTFASVMNRGAAERLALEHYRMARKAAAALPDEPGTLTELLEMMMDNYRQRSQETS